MRKTLLLTGLLILGLFLMDDLMDRNVKGAADADFNLDDSIDRLAYSFEPAPVFSESPLSESIMAKEVKEQEADQAEVVVQQHESDLQEKAIYLTFDDGPSNVTSELLDLLDDYGMKATFFMLGPNMRANPEMVQRKHEEGHGLALHGMTHEVQQVYGHADAPTEEMTEGQEIVEQITGIQTNMVRTPYGSVPYLTDPMRYLLYQQNFKVWDWNVDSLDWKYNDGGYVKPTIQKILNVIEEGETPVILLHDREATVKYLPKLLSFIQKQGYQTKILTNDMEPIIFSCDGQCESVH